MFAQKGFADLPGSLKLAATKIIFYYYYYCYYFYISV